MPGELTASSTVVIKREPAAVWAALTDPELLSKAFLGAKVETDWREGSPVTFSGEWEGRPYRDKGKVVRMVPTRLMEFTHWSPLSGTADEPENYHTVTLELTPQGEGTQLSLRQTNVNDEAERQHSEQTWSLMLNNIKNLVES